MFAEPISVTYDTVPTSLARVSYGNSSGEEPAVFVTPDGEFSLFIRETPRAETILFEVSLERIEQDADGDPFTGHWSPLPNRFGLVFEVNRLRYNSATDLPLLQSALLALVDGPFRDRIINGEK